MPRKRHVAKRNPAKNKRTLVKCYCWYTPDKYYGVDKRIPVEDCPVRHGI